MRRTLLALLAALLALLILSPALAHERDGRPHVQSFQENRNVRASTSEAGAEFELLRAFEPTSDVIKVRFDGKTGTVTYEYRLDSAIPDPPFTFRVVMDRLVEYEDSNGNHQYDPGIDRAERSYAVGAMRWNVSEPDATELRGQSITVVTATGTFGPASSPGEFRLQFVAHGRAMRVALAEMHPQDVKMNWNYASFPFQSPDTRLALVARFETPAGAEVIEDLTPENATKGLLASAPGFFAFFDWATESRGNSTGEPPIDRVVVARVARTPETTTDGFESRRIVFSYPRADVLLSHDPTLGFEYAPSTPSILPWRPLLALALAGAVLAGGGYAYGRHRRRGGPWGLLSAFRRSR